MTLLAAVGSQVCLFLGLFLNCAEILKNKNQLGPMCSAEENEDDLNIWDGTELTQEFPLQA